MTETQKERRDRTTHWSIIYGNTLIVLTTFQHVDEYCYEHINSRIVIHSCYKENHGAHLTKKVSPVKIDVLIDLINEFIGIGYIWIVIGQRYGSLAIDVVGVDCKHVMKEASIYYVKINKVYERCHLESQWIIT
uniref:Zn-finger protein n=1 Tax=Pithovirus LCPAC403 TaxID=2506596 RepID=A0A481ZCU3_9VIRU|nr:MAG: Zn-finger protein [Pithovirus LCPAC403]